MKNRSGFVSNSSTSSFLIYGASIDSSDASNWLREHKNLSDDDIDAMDSWEIREILEAEAGLNFFGNSDYGMYVGASWDEVGDDETGKQFKARVEAKIKEVFPDASLSTYEEAWYDG